MSTQFVVPLCPQCGGPLQKYPTREEPISCEFCGGKVFGKEDTSRDLKAEYHDIYKEVLTIKLSYPQFELVGEDITKIRVPIQHGMNEYDVLLVLDDFPNDVFVDYPRGLRNLIGPPRYLNTLSTWTPRRSHAVDVLKEITVILTKRQFIPKAEVRPLEEDLPSLSRQYQIETVNPDLSKIFIYTPRTNFSVDLQTSLKPPKIKVPERIKRALPVTKMLESRYNNGEVTLGDMIGRLEYAVNVQDRIITEIQLLRNNFTQVQYYPESRQVLVTVPIATEAIQFRVDIPEKFPIIRPIIQLRSPVRNRQVQDIIEQRMNQMLSMWTRFMHIMDVLSDVQAAAIGHLYRR